MYYTGIDPLTKQSVYVARGLPDPRMQWVLMQFFNSVGKKSGQYGTGSERCTCPQPYTAGRSGSGPGCALYSPAKPESL